jgi:acetyl-CoA C-acetyltransferase
MAKRIFVAAYRQSGFGKLLGMPVPEILNAAVEGVCAEIGVPPSTLDVASVGATCHVSLNEQGLLAGLVAEVPGLAGKPIESVENACASGGEAVLSVVRKLRLGEGETGVAVGYERMRDGEGKMDGKLIGRALGFFSHPDEREGRTFVFPHLFAEVMRDYMAEWGVTERDLAHVVVQEYANARHNPFAQMRKVSVTLDQVLAIEGINRYVVEGLPLKTYDCSQISDGWSALILATEEGLARLGVKKADTVELAGYGQATDPLRKGGRDVLRPAGARKAMADAYRMAGLAPSDVSVAEVHDCFSVMGAIGAEVVGAAREGEGARYWVEGKAAPGGPCALNTSGGLLAKGHPIGATGVAMVGWCAWQLLGKAPKELQVKAPWAAATFNIGGPICATVATVLKPAV